MTAWLLPGSRGSNIEPGHLFDLRCKGISVLSSIGPCCPIICHDRRLFYVSCGLLSHCAKARRVTIHQIIFLDLSRSRRTLHQFEIVKHAMNAWRPVFCLGMKCRQCVSDDPVNKNNVQFCLKREIFRPDAVHENILPFMSLNHHRFSVNLNAPEGQEAPKSKTASKSIYHFLS